MFVFLCVGVPRMKKKFSKLYPGICSLIVVRVCSSTNATANQSCLKKSKR